MLFWQWLNTSHDKGHDDRNRRRPGTTLKLVVKNVRLPDCDDLKTTWNVICEKGIVSAMTPYTDHDQLPNSTPSSEIQYDELDAQGSLLLPSLCHSHIHLDKCFILDRCGDLETGYIPHFQEFSLFFFFYCVCVRKGLHPTLFFLFFSQRFRRSNESDWNCESCFPIREG